MEKALSTHKLADEDRKYKKITLWNLGLPLALFLTIIYCIVATCSQSACLAREARCSRKHLPGYVPGMPEPGRR